MEEATLAISLSGRTRIFFGKKLREDRFNTSRECIRCLTRDGRDLNNGADIDTIIRRLRDDSALPGQDADVARTGRGAIGASSRPNRRGISAGRDA